MNFINASLRCLNYKDINETVKKLLLTLQKKLIIIASIFTSVFSSTIKRVIAEVKDFIEYKDSELRKKFLRSNREISAQYICNIAVEQLNFITETISCKQLVLCVIMRELTI